jgi:hypothetical protein
MLLSTAPGAKSDVIKYNGRTGSFRVLQLLRCVLRYKNSKQILKYSAIKLLNVLS